MLKDDEDKIVERVLESGIQQLTNIRKQSEAVMDHMAKIFVRPNTNFCLKAHLLKYFTIADLTPAIVQKIGHHLVSTCIDFSGQAKILFELNLPVKSMKQLCLDEVEAAAAYKVRSLN